MRPPRFYPTNTTEPPSPPPLPLPSSPQVNYCGAPHTFSATQVLGMLFTNMKEIVKLQPMHRGIRDVETVISVPCYFTDAQRRAVRDAAQIGGLNCLRVLNDGTATALSYGIFRGAKKEFPEDKETPVLFLDCGSTQFTATAVTFTNTSLKVLATVSDGSFGGRDLDEAIAKEFSEVHKAKAGKGDDTWANKKARLKLLAMAEKAKITLSPHGVNEAPCNIECLMNDRDFAYTLTVEKLEELVSARTNAVVSSVIRRCLATAGLTSGADFAAIELVGGSARPRIIKRAIATALGLKIDEANSHGLSMSMNLDEACARGCALACAQLSPIFKVKPFDVSEAVPAGVRLSWESSAGGGGGVEAAGMEEEGAGDAAGGGSSSAPAPGATSVALFSAGMRTLTVRQLKLNKSSTFELSAEYETSEDSTLLAGTSRHIAKFRLDVPAVELAPGARAPHVRADFKLDMNCSLVCVGATLLRDAPESAAAEEAPAGMAVEGGAAAGSGETGEAAAAGAAGAPDAAAAPPSKKKKLIKTAIPLVVTAPGMTQGSLTTACDGERTMIARDADIHETQDARNGLEAFIYSTRSALDDALLPFSTPPELEALSSALTAMEDWVTGDGFSSDKATFAAKLAEMQAAAGPLISRKAEADGRYSAVQVLQDTIARFRDVLENRSGKHSHLEEADKDTLRGELGGAERWLADMQAKQAALERYNNPVLTLAALRTQKEGLEKVLGPIERRPVPVAAPPPPPPASAAPAEAPATEAPAAAEPAAEGAAAPDMQG